LSEKSHGNNFKLDLFITTLAHELVHFMDAKVDLKLNLAPLEVNKKCITPMGIIINELVTNTLKHAFQAEQENKQISISLEKKDAVAILEYFDNGIGISPNLESRDGSLGMKLIGNLAQQLKGDMEIRENKGTHIIIRFKC
jgi:two-component sensor histidine kinase